MAACLGDLTITCRLLRAYPCGCCVIALQMDGSNLVQIYFVEVDA